MSHVANGTAATLNLAEVTQAGNDDERLAMLNGETKDAPSVHGKTLQGTNN